MKMKVTYDLLKRYKACKQGLEFMQEFYPDGAEALDIVNEHEVPIEFLHFARQYFDLNEEELKKYFELCNVDSNCENIWSSQQITNSQNVSYSTNVRNSAYVQTSRDIRNSRNIYGSLGVIGSKEIFMSSNVKDSLYIVSTTDVTCSEQVMNSRNIQWSNMIYSSRDVSDSSFITCSLQANNCSVSGFLTNCSNCLFCYAIGESKYQIFNQQVSVSEFEYWKSFVDFLLEKEKKELIKIQEDSFNGARMISRPKITSIFDDLSEDFFGEIGTIPYYDEEIFLDLFFKLK